MARMSGRAGRPKQKRLAAAIAVGATAALLWWSSASQPDDAQEAARVAAADERSETAAAPTPDALATDAGRADPVEVRDGDSSGARRPAVVAPSGAAASSRPLGHTLLLELELPHGGHPAQLSGSVALRSSSGRTRKRELAGSALVEFPGLALESWEVEVAADGYRETRQTFDLQFEAQATHQNDEGPLRFVKSLTLWPLQAVSVHVRMRDGELEPVLRQAFVLDPFGAGPQRFEVLCFARRPDADPAHWTTDRRLARFEAWTGRSGFVRSDGWVGVLTREAREPFWVALRLEAQVLAWQRLAEGASDLTFELSAQEISGLLAWTTVRLRAADPQAAVAPTAVALHVVDCERQTVQRPAACSCGGHYLARAQDAQLWSFGAVRPGAYQLSIVLDGTELTSLVQVHAGRPNQLGPFELPSRAAKGRLEVVDASGQPVLAEIVFAPRAGAGSALLPLRSVWAFHEAIGLVRRTFHRTSLIVSPDSPASDFVLPLQPSLVRVLPIARALAGPRALTSELDFTPTGPPPPGENASPLAVETFEFDPARPPAMPWRIVLSTPSWATIDSGEWGREAPAKLEIVDRFGDLLDASPVSPSTGARRWLLAPGPYRCRVRACDGALFAEQTFEVGATDLFIKL